MAIRRYVAATTREAMLQVRRELGEDAVILSSKRVGNRLEILAAAPDAVEALVERSEARAAAAAPAREPPPREPARPKIESFQDYLRRQSQADGGRAAGDGRPRAADVAMYEDVAQIRDEETPPARQTAATAPADAAAASPRPAVASAAPRAQPHRAPQIEPPAPPQPAVFRRRPAVVAPVAQPAAHPSTPPQPATASAAPASEVAAPAAAPAARPSVAASAPAMNPPAAAPAPATAPVPAHAAHGTAATPASVPPAPLAAASIAPVAGATPFELALPAAAAGAAETVAQAQLLAELQSMRALLQQQLAALASVERAPRESPQTRVMTRLLTAGFTVEVARRVAAHAPAGAVNPDAWLQDVLALNVRVAGDGEDPIERAGKHGGAVVALVGPTGVGKTTTVAKLAARFAVRYGTSALGLITLDAYRVAAPEQLRTYGRILGTPVHLAQDAATLRELLATMAHKKLVLIDTCGLSQRDERVGELLDLLTAAATPARPIARVLLMNAASHAETLEEAARAWRAHECAGAILTKLDEAVRIGGALDVALRHRLLLLGVTNGQRVPEDWHPANARLLAHLALKPGSPLFELAPEEGSALAPHA